MFFLLFGCCTVWLWVTIDILEYMPPYSRSKCVGWWITIHCFEKEWGKGDIVEIGALPEPIGWVAWGKLHRWRFYGPRNTSRSHQQLMFLCNRPFKCLPGRTLLKKTYLQSSGQDLSQTPAEYKSNNTAAANPLLFGSNTLVMNE
jgi:hypothetical protein